MAEYTVIYWAEIYWGRRFIRAESSLIQSGCRSFIRVIVPYEISKVNSRFNLIQQWKTILREKRGVACLTSEPG
jgi:hypothetical protein